MSRYCSKCGLEIPLGARYCSSCGKKTEGIKKSTVNTVIVVAVILIVLIAVGAVMVLLHNDTPRFYGTWKVDYASSGSSATMLWTFNTNASVKTVTSYSLHSGPQITCDTSTAYNTEDAAYYMLSVKNISSDKFSSTTQWGKFEIKDGKLYLTSFGGISGGLIGYGLDYSFIDENHIQLTLPVYAIGVIALTRITETTINHSQSSEKINWSDINITIHGPLTVNYNEINLTRSTVQYSGASSPEQWGTVTVGDTILLGYYQKTSSSFSVSMKWIPTYLIIGTWYYR